MISNWGFSDHVSLKFFLFVMRSYEVVTSVVGIFKLNRNKLAQIRIALPSMCSGGGIVKLMYNDCCLNSPQLNSLNSLTMIKRKNSPVKKKCLPYSYRGTNRKPLKVHGKVNCYIELCKLFSRISNSFPRNGNSFPRIRQMNQFSCPVRGNDLQYSRDRIV